jgi:site-specific DNA-cytosine methylase
MCEALLVSKTAWYSRQCALTWKVKVTKYKRSIFQLSASAHRTKENEFGLWRTPDAVSGGKQSSRNSESIRSGTFKETERSTDTSEITRPSERTETMADTESKRTGENNERLRSGTSGVSGRQGTIRIQEDVANTNESISRERQIFGNPNDKGRGASETRRESLQPEDRQTRTDNLGSGSEVMANTNSERQQEQCRPKSIQEEGNELECSSSQSGRNFWDIEPDVGRVVNGLPGRVHRLKGLGNAIVPQIAEEIGRAIMKAEQ